MIYIKKTTCAQGLMSSKNMQTGPNCKIQRRGLSSIGGSLVTGFFFTSFDLWKWLKIA